MVTARPLSVGVVGHGAIGSVVATALDAGEVPGAVLAGVSVSSRSDFLTGPTLSHAELIERSDLVVECAGHDAVRAIGVATLEAGSDLLLVSTGALTDGDLLERLASSGPGRLKLSTGAIGGIDLIRAARLQGHLHGVRLTSTKRPSTLPQVWMDDEMRTQLERGDQRTVVFEGNARQAADLFPRSANVAAALAIACGTWDGVEATIIADPDAASTSHEIECCGEAGQYRFTIRNRPSPDNPATSAVVAYAVLRAIADDAGATWRFQ